jgi:hypothetical protein
MKMVFEDYLVFFNDLQSQFRNDWIVQNGLPASLDFRKSEMAGELDAPMNRSQIVRL